MADRHPLGCDPETFRSLPDSHAIAHQRIPRRNLSSNNIPLRTFSYIPKSNHPSWLTQEPLLPRRLQVSYIPQQKPHFLSVPIPRPRPALPPLRPLENTQDERIQRLQFPGLDHAIDQVCRLTRRMAASHPPYVAFDTSLDNLITIFIKHVQAERKLLNYRRKGIKSRKSLVSLSVEPHLSKKRSPSKKGDEQDPDFSVKAYYTGRIHKDSATQRSNRESTPVVYDDSDVNQGPALRTRLPRKSKQNGSNLAENDSDHSSLESSEAPAVTTWVQPAAPRNVLANRDLAHLRAIRQQRQAVERKDEWSQPASCPRPFVFQRSLCSDYTSLTPNIALNEDDDGDDGLQFETRVKSKTSRRKSKLVSALIERASHRVCGVRLGCYAGVPLHNRRLTKNDSVVVVQSVHMDVSTSLGSTTGEDASPVHKYTLLQLEKVSVGYLRKKDIWSQKVRHKWKPGAALRHARELYREKMAQLENVKAEEFIEVEDLDVKDVERRKQRHEGIVVRRTKAEVTQAEMKGAGQVDIGPHKMQGGLETKRRRSEAFDSYGGNGDGKQISDGGGVVGRVGNSGGRVASQLIYSAFAGENGMSDRPKKIARTSQQSVGIRGPSSTRSSGFAWSASGTAARGNMNMNTATRASGMGSDAGIRWNGKGEGRADMGSGYARSGGGPRQLVVRHRAKGGVQRHGMHRNGGSEPSMGVSRQDYGLQSGALMPSPGGRFYRSASGGYAHKHAGDDRFDNRGDGVDRRSEYTLQLRYPSGHQEWSGNYMNGAVYERTRHAQSGAMQVQKPHGVRNGEFAVGNQQPLLASTASRSMVVPRYMPQTAQEIGAARISQLPPDVQKHYQEQYKAQYWAEMKRRESKSR